ncbi:hypothetical protein [Moorena producens]|uniref:hypothetical protein n=1 Tax=Moorena producens TaxID=1155739 RepID=UPI000AA20CC4|nr:hypothetical protein [Moorena producens]
MRYTLFFPLASCLLPLASSLLPAPCSLLPAPFAIYRLIFRNKKRYPQGYC